MMSSGQAFIVGILAGALCGLVLGGKLARGAAQQRCENRICEQYRSGKWIDGKCYDAATLREVRP